MKKQVLISRERWIVRRKSDGAIFCGMTRSYEFRKPEEIGHAAIKTYRSEKKALAAFDSSWSSSHDIEPVKVVETIAEVTT